MSDNAGCRRLPHCCHRAGLHDRVVAPAPLSSGRRTDSRVLIISWQTVFYGKMPDLNLQLRWSRHMTSKHPHPYLFPTRIDLSAEVRASLIELLNQTLANTLDLRTQV